MECFHRSTVKSVIDFCLFKLYNEPNCAVYKKTCKV